jgi:4-amino-4-deoxy-L-arabinose transferase-like glycosyltransferase
MGGATRHAGMVIAGIVLAALVLRLGLAAEVSPATIGGDPKVYDGIAVGLATGHGWSRPVHRPGAGARRRPTALHPPAWPLLLGATYAVAVHAPAAPHDRWLAGREVNAVLTSAGVGLVGGIGLELWGPVVGIVAASLAALYPPPAVLGVALLSEPLFVAFELAALLAVLRRRRSPHPWRWLAAAGVLTGLATLTRANGAVLLGPLALAVWTARPRWSWRALAAPAVLVACALATVAPWTVRNALVLHHVVPVATDLGQTVRGTYNPVSAANRFRWRGTHKLPHSDRAAVNQPNEATRSAALTRLGLRYVRRHPVAVAQAAWWNTLREFDLQAGARGNLAGEVRSRALGRVSVAAFAAMAALALAGAFTARARRAPRFVWLIPVLMWLGTVLLAVNFSRFRAPLEPFFVLLGALAATAAGERLARRGRERRRSRVALPA